MPTDLETMLEMGFAEVRAQKALAKSGYKGVMAAIEWLQVHQEDPDIDEPFEMPPGHTLNSSPTEGEGNDDAAKGEGKSDAEAKSIKCDDCGKLLGSDANVQMHAARTGHSNFSESTDEVKPLTEEEKIEQAKKVKEKLKQKREERMRKEQEEARAKERIRRKQGKDHTGIKQKMADDEMKKIAEETRREKLEAKQARQNVKEQIERDKADRQKLFPTHGTRPEESAATPAPASAATPSAAPVTNIQQKVYDQTRLQIRLSTGQPLTETFSVNEVLGSVRLFVQKKQDQEFDEPHFTFMTTFPRKVFTDDDMLKSLKELDLVPSAVLMVKEL